MGVIIKQSFWGTFIAYLGLIIGYLNALYFRPEYFNLEQIGVFTLITANAMLISPLAAFGMGSSFIKFFPEFDPKYRNRFFTFLLLLTLVGNLLILATGYLLKDFITERYADAASLYAEYLYVTGIIIIANSFFDLFFSYSRTVLKVIFPSFIRDIFLRLTSLLLVVGFAFGWWSFHWVIVGLGIIYLSALSLLILQLFFFHGFRIDLHLSFDSPEWRYRLFKYAIYSMGVAGSFAIINNVTYDQVSTILGTDMNGIYTTCFFIAIIVEMPRRNMAKVMSPILSNEFSKNNMVEVARLYQRSSITMSVLGALLFIGIVTNLNDLFAFIPQGNTFAMGFWVVIGVCGAKLALMVSSFSGEIINYSNHYRYNLVFQILAALTLILLNTFMIPKWGLNGAVLSYFSTIVFHIFLKGIYVYRQFNIHPLIPTHFHLLIIAVLVTLFAWNFEPDFHPVINIIIRSLLTSVLFFILVYGLKVSSDINQLIHSTFERFLKIKLPK